MHTLRRFGVPLTVARTRWMLGSKRRFVILRDHGRLLPKPGLLGADVADGSHRELLNDRGCQNEGPATSGQPQQEYPMPRARRESRVEPA